MPKSERIAWLDVAKGTSILLVVFLHAGVITEQYGIRAVQGWLIHDILRPVRIPVFFLVSGILAHPYLRLEWRDFIRRRLLLLVYLLLLWTAIRHVFFAAGSDYVPEPFGATDPTVVVTTLIDPPNEIWFIWGLALFFLTARLLHRFLLPVSILLSVLSIATFSGVLGTDASDAHLNVLRFAPFFFIGIVVGDRIKAFVAQGHSVTALSLAGGFAALFAIRGETSGLAWGTLTFVLCIVGSLLACILARGAAHLPVVRPVLLYFGRNTLPIYVAHMLPMSALAMGSLVLIDNPLRSYVLVPLLVAGSVAVTLLLKAAAVRLGAGWLYALPKPLAG